MTPVRAFLLACAIALPGCVTPPPALPQRAVVDVEAVTQAIRVQREADARAAIPPPAGAAWFEVIEGRIPVLVTAPHATQPFREGSYRFADGGGTAALARMLNQLTGATVIYTTYASPSDPNYYDDNAFKAQVRALVERTRPRLVLDLHASHSFRPYDVDFGTMEGKSLLGQQRLLPALAAALRNEGLVNLSTDYFAAARNQTLTKFASSLGVPAVQLEISTTWLVPADGDLAAHRFAQLLQALVRFIRAEQGTAP